MEVGGGEKEKGKRKRERKKKEEKKDEEQREERSDREEETKDSQKDQLIDGFSRKDWNMALSTKEDLMVTGDGGAVDEESTEKERVSEMVEGGTEVVEAHSGVAEVETHELVEVVEAKDTNKDVALSVDNMVLKEEPITHVGVDVIIEAGVEDTQEKIYSTEAETHVTAEENGEKT
ncbi:hypothetical protein Dimus_010983 [Dionaea muscipula]